MPLQRLPLLGTAIAALLLLGSASLLHNASSALQKPPLFLAPMMDVTDSCINPGNANAQVPASLSTVCTQGATASAAQLVEQTLAQLPDPQQSAQASPSYELGYTLAIPLLQLYIQDSQGQWVIDPERVERFVRTLRDTPRSAIVYLFATHFSALTQLEQELAQDPNNLAQTQTGPIAPSDYLGSPLYAWSVARTDNSITQYRQQAIAAIVQGICQAGDEAANKVRGLTLLGEVHQLFPEFATGTGYTEPYLITDYSEASMAQWQAYLQARFSQIERLNQALGSRYTSWSAVPAPRRNLASQPEAEQTAQRLEHIDAYSHGLIPVGGWAYLADAALQAQSRILVYVDGVRVARLPIDMGRQDVLDARAEFGDRAVGWQTYLDYSQWASGAHQVRIYMQTPGQDLQLLDSKVLQVNTGKPASQSTQNLRWPRSTNVSPDWAFYVDLPQENRNYLFNPLASLWHDFRQVQVNNYLRSFSQVLESSCLAAKPLYLHQIIPHTNPGWDPQKFAIQRSLKPQPGLRLGVSLYGEPSTSASFLNNLNAQGQRHYGVTEFHPLKPLSPTELEQALQQHRRAGAEFLSFFMEPAWQGAEIERIANPFSLSPSNPFKGSNTTFESLRSVLQP